MHIGRIRKVGEISKNIWDFSAQEPQNLSVDEVLGKSMALALQKLGRSAPYPHSADLIYYQALSRTLVSDRNIWDQRCQKGEGFFHYHRSPPTYFQPELDAEVRKHEWRLILEDMQIFTVQRTVLVLQEGILGLGPTSSRVGDDIVILMGCIMPLVIRPHPGNASDTYDLIGAW
jgi:hypothetical protein